MSTDSQQRGGLDSKHKKGRYTDEAVVRVIKHFNLLCLQIKQQPRPTWLTYYSNLSIRQCMNTDIQRIGTFVQDSYAVYSTTAYSVYALRLPVRLAVTG